MNAEEVKLIPIEAALVHIENTILALTDKTPAPYLRVGVNISGGWFAQIADPEDLETPFYGQGPCFSAEQAILDLSLFIKDCEG